MRPLLGDLSALTYVCMYICIHIQFICMYVCLNVVLYVPSGNRHMEHSTNIRSVGGERREDA